MRLTASVSRHYVILCKTYHTKASAIGVGGMAGLVARWALNLLPLQEWVRDCFLAIVFLFSFSTVQLFLWDFNIDIHKSADNSAQILCYIDQKRNRIEVIGVGSIFSQNP